MRNIDLLVEKYLTSFKKWNHIIDIYVNPTHSEFNDIEGEIRFIADATNKKLYIFSAMTAVHMDVWKTLKDQRSLYKSGDIVTGELDHRHKIVSIDSYYLLPFNIRKEVQSQDWSFVKLFDLDSIIKGAGK